MGRHCAVPNCYTGYRYRKTEEKISLYRVPDDEYFLMKWNEAIAREDRPITPKDYVCDKHFTSEDIIRQRIVKDVITVYQRPKLRQDAVPSIFPELPEYITQMTKKRRKIDIGHPQMPTTNESFVTEDSNEAEHSGNTIKMKNEPGEEFEIKQESSESNSLSQDTYAFLSNEIFIKAEDEYIENN